MSDHSTVILTWAAIDDHAEDVDRRLAEIDEQWNRRTRNAWIVAYPCPDERSVGSACEVVAVTHCNYFDPGDLMAALKSLPWEMPEEVEVLWKDEEMTRYDARHLVPLGRNDFHVRPETGPMRFGGDGTGVFIRGDTALHMAQQARQAGLTELADVLESCHHDNLPNPPQSAKLL